ncbi:hypothetical protein ACFY3U_11885 [Micromonospora sp. NPDC000089]|uniref:hypothetical protein n=1 Tax=unclassified Micromonospora TaxID=2617518 RepID=UPI003698DC36
MTDPSYYGYEPDPRQQPPRRAQTYATTPAPSQPGERHYSVPVNQYSQYAYASSSTAAAPQFTDSFNGGRRVSPPTVPSRSSQQDSRHSSAASGQLAELRRRSTYVVNDPDALVNMAVQVRAVSTTRPVEPRRDSQVSPANPSRPTNSEARQGAQNAGFKGLTDFKAFMNHYLPPGTEFTASSLSAISGVLEGWAARGTQIGAASVTALKSGVEFIDAARTGDWTKAAVHAGNLTGMGMSIAGTAANITQLTAAGGIVVGAATLTNATVDQRRAAIQQQSQNIDLESGQNRRQSNAAAPPAGRGQQQAPARGR